MKEYNEYNDRLVGFDVAVKADISGFKAYNPECFTCSKDKKLFFDNWTGVIPDDQMFLCYRPTQTALQKWIREKHNIEVYCEPWFYENISTEYFVRVDKFDKRKKAIAGTLVEKTYENGLEMGLEIALNYIIKLSK